MPTFKRNDVSIYYEEYGSGFPILLFAPGGMRSAIEFWHKSPFDPTVELANDFRVIAMDQRNAGQSRAPVTGADGWDTYTNDHLALLDHLGIKRTHAMGGCIGSSYSLNLIKLAPDRVAAAVLQNPIGLHNNREAFYEMFDGWGKSLQGHQPDLTTAALASFRERMYGTDFVFNVDQDFVRRCSTPLLVLAGDDLYHPAPTSRRIAELAPHAEILVDWKRPEVIAATVARVRTFLKSHQ
jgi:pimeloyl-ACP methyl ester carboxylesterase